MLKYPLVELLTKKFRSLAVSSVNQQTKTTIENSVLYDMVRFYKRLLAIPIVDQKPWNTNMIVINSDNYV